MLRWVQIGVVAGLLSTLLACQRSQENADAPAAGETVSSTEGLIEIPTPDLSRADVDAREHMAGLRDQLDALDPYVEAIAAARAYGDLGSAYLVYDFLDATRACFGNAHTLAPDDFRWAYLLGYVHQLEGRLEDAIPLLIEVASREPDFLPALLRLGRGYLERGDPDQAESWFQKALDQAPDTPAGFEGLGKAAAARDEFDDAIGYLEKALLLAPKANSLNYALAQLHRKRGDLERARAYLAVRGDIAVRIEDPLLNPLGTLGQSVQLHLMHAAEAMEDTDYETAVGAYHQALAVDDRNFTAYRGLSYAVERLGDLDGAIEHLTTGLSRINDPDPVQAASQRVEARRILGGLNALADRDGQAIEHFEQALVAAAEGDQTLPAVRLKLANALAREQRFDEALRRYDEVLTTTLDSATQAAVLERRATALVNLGRGDEAVADFERALAVAPNDGGLRLRYADALAVLGKAEAAGQARERVVQQGSADGAARARLLAETGRRLLSQGQLQEAVDHFDGSLELDPEQPAVRHQLAQVLGHLGFFEDALREFRAVVDSAPRHAAARRGEITVLLLTDQYGVARMRLQDALRTFPLDADLALTQALLLAACPDAAVRDGELAFEIVSRVRQVQDTTLTREALAVVLAATGRFDEAATVQQALVTQAESIGEPQRLAAQRARLNRFDRREAWVAQSGEEIVAVVGAGQSRTTEEGTGR